MHGLPSRALVSRGAMALEPGSEVVPLFKKSAPDLLLVTCEWRRMVVQLAIDSILRKDQHSFSEPNKVAVRHIDLDLQVDFDVEKIHGRAVLHLSRPAKGALVLDTHGLEIYRVKAYPMDTDVEYALGDEIEYLGRPLSIDLPTNTSFVAIEYAVGERPGALQWLRPCQTTGTVYPFLFTQSQTIGARTWIPCQDTPSVRTTYHARVKVPQGMMAVMSAENPIAKSSNGIYEFRCSYPIPSYLFALAIGDLEYRSLSPRSGVYAERAIVSQAAWEFANLEGMMRAAEKLFGSYRWKRFDLIVLPPSFPLGGMENPQLVFVTPTVLAGDRSLTSLIAHELSHSWSGNLVTNATWNDFWLNEGFSVFAEHRIMEELNGKAYDDMLALLSFRTLTTALGNLPCRDTWLDLDLQGRHPDECFTDIPYQKGYFFLRMLEETFGRDCWDRFLHKYFDNFAFQSISSSTFLSYLREQLIGGDNELEKGLHLEEWIYGPGLPGNCPTVYSSELEQVDAQIRTFEKGASAVDLITSGWTTHHWVYFLSNMRKPIDGSRMRDLESVFHFSETRNKEILYNWLLLCIASNFEAADCVLENFLINNGRMKYVRTVYRELVKTRDGRTKAAKIYRDARSKYHSTIVRIIDDMLGC